MARVSAAHSCFLEQGKRKEKRMKSSGKTAEEARALAEPVAEALGYFIWDVEYVKEGTEWFLRITIDSEDGIDIEDCEKMSHAMDPVLDEADIIEGSYRLEISSPGIEREIKNDFHLSKCMGEKVQVKLYTQINGSKTVIGTLDGYSEECVTVDGKDIPKKSIAKMNIYFEF